MNIMFSNDKDKDEFFLNFLCRSIFIACDKNNDGYIDLGEFMHYEDIDEENRAKGFELIDLDKDGKISFQGNHF